MKRMLTAIALAIALPAVAYAQATPAPAAKTAGQEAMKGMDCKDMAGMAGHDMSKMAGHDMSAGANAKAGHCMKDPAAKQPGANALQAGPHQNHKQ